MVKTTPHFVFGGLYKNRSRSLPVAPFLLHACMLVCTNIIHYLCFTDYLKPTYRATMEMIHLILGTGLALH